MQLIVVREATDRSAGGGPGFLRYALSTAPLHDVVLDGLRYLWCRHRADEPAERIGWTAPDRSLWVLPGSWQAGLAAAPGPTVFYGASLSIDAREGEGPGKPSWLVIANGRFAAHANHSLLERYLETTRADCLAVTADSELLASQERLRLTQDNHVVGYRRLYADSLSPTPVPRDWPHFLVVRPDASEIALEGGLLSRFEVWADRCRGAGLKLQGIAVAGSAYDLESEDGILSVSRVGLRYSSRPDGTMRPGESRPSRPDDSQEVSPHSHLIGSVLLGKQVTIEAGAVVVGPTVLCDGSTVGRNAIVDSAIVGSGVSIEPSQSLGGCVVMESGQRSASDYRAPRMGPLPQEHVGARHHAVFRSWPRLSYARCFKRIADVVAAVLVLILFAPVIPVIALAVKINSPGPAFFRDKRQGLHGRPFHCVKFRTMKQGADKMQDKLRFVSEVDGPQFKMTDDPRITTVGRFLRETYLDEIPQFFNVLCGQMSVVGPRPSPESENTLCPSWRDARLSVRPGITGLWQVYRTRQSQRDFQEWILYDTQYVRDFSFGLDLWICWRTFRRMVENFVNQF
jgi:lipopolysaccharide/colanic/teichoic acid biosynthesis glycosyltransferase